MSYRRKIRIKAGETVDLEIEGHDGGAVLFEGCSIRFVETRATHPGEVHFHGHAPAQRVAPPRDDFEYIEPGPFETEWRGTGVGWQGRGPMPGSPPPPRRPRTSPFGETVPPRTEFRVDPAWQARREERRRMDEADAARSRATAEFFREFFNSQPPRGYAGQSAPPPPPRPAAAVEPWRAALGFAPGASVTFDEVKTRYRELISKAHPDAGGEHEDAVKLNVAWQAAQKAYGQR